MPDPAACVDFGATPATLPSQKKRNDSHSWLSVVETQAEPEEVHLPSHHGGLPMLLIGFVFILSLIVGFAVVLVHKAIYYSGCALGINGCFEPDDGRIGGGFVFRAVDTLSSGEVPHELIYIIVAALGALLVGLIAGVVPHNISFQITGGGTIQSVTAIAYGDCIGLPAAVLRVLVTTLFLGSGGSLGKAGPIIQVATAVTTLIGWALGLRAVPTQSLLGSIGVACGFAGAFNAPLAGLTFAMEELRHATHRFSGSIIGIMLMAAAVTTAVVRMCEGNTVIFKSPLDAQILDGVRAGSFDSVNELRLWMLIAIPIGVICSIAGTLIVRGLRYLNSKLEENFSKMSRTAWWIFITVTVTSIGLVVFSATGFRGIWGVGYTSLQQTLDAESSASDYAVFAVGKATAMVLSIAVRLPGDALEPVLVIGGFLGGMVGRVLSFHKLLGNEVMKPCTILGMSGLFASCFRHTITPVVLALELTGMETYSMILPIVLCCFVANTLSNYCDAPLFLEIMRQDGIDLQPFDEVDEVDPEKDDVDPTSERSSTHSSGTHEFSLPPCLEEIDDGRLPRWSPAPPSWGGSVTSSNGSSSRISKKKSGGNSRRGTSDESVGEVRYQEQVTDGGVLRMSPGSEPASPVRKGRNASLVAKIEGSLLAQALSDAPALRDGFFSSPPSMTGSSPAISNNNSRRVSDASAMTGPIPTPPRHASRTNTGRTNCSGTSTPKRYADVSPHGSVTVHLRGDAVSPTTSERFCASVPECMVSSDIGRGQTLDVNVVVQTTFTGTGFKANAKENIHLQPEYAADQEEACRSMSKDVAEPEAEMDADDSPPSEFPSKTVGGGPGSASFGPSPRGSPRTAQQPQQQQQQHFSDHEDREGGEANVPSSILPFPRFGTN